jgi:hypothetical protein
MIRRRMAISPPDRLIGACEAALRRLETAIVEPPPETTDEPPHTFAEIGEVLFWLYAIGDTETGQILSPGFQWARHQYAHGNLLTDATEYHYGATLGRMMLGAVALGAPPVHLWTPREHISTHRKAKDHRKLSAKEEAARELQWTDYGARVAGEPVVATLWDELSELVANVNPRDLAPWPRP